MANMLALIPVRGCVVLCICVCVCVCVAAWPALTGGDPCPSSEWSAMCRPCCEYQLIRCQCPSKGSEVGYTVPCCRNALDQCDPCIVHPGCSLFENCKTCHNGTWEASDDFFVNGRYCRECRPGWRGGDCKACGGDVQRPQGHVALEGYPTSARCEWTVRVETGHSVELRFTQLSLESDPSCRYDYVEVRDGDSVRSPVIGRFCGDQLPPGLKSSGSHLHVLFISDGYNNFDGLAFTFQQTSGTEGPACPPPQEPVNGYVLPTFGPKEAPQAVTYRCHPAFALSGSQQRTCRNGTWSGTAPACVKACREPKVSELVQQRVVTPPPLPSFAAQGLPSAGAAARTLPLGFHRVLTSIEYRCASPLFRHAGSPRRTCLRTGRWSGRHVSCSPVCGEFNPLGAGSLSEAQWPWHAAVYVPAGPQGPGAVASDQQGPSGASTRWRLACSGALLSRRSVLVAAECVAAEAEQRLLRPPLVQVVIGPRRRTAQDALEGPQHLRVSDILVHPRFYSAPGSSVAVLKLQDKARISRRVLPVCLLKMGEEVTMQQAYASRWILTNHHRHLSRFAPSSQTELVQLSDVAQCERELAGGGANETVTGDGGLCVVSRPPRPHGSCSAAIPGLTVAPATSPPAAEAPRGHTETQEASDSNWKLLGLERFSYEETSCHKQTHTLQTPVAHFQAWIEENMK